MDLVQPLSRDVGVLSTGAHRRCCSVASHQPRRRSIELSAASGAHEIEVEPNLSSMRVISTPEGPGAVVAAQTAPPLLTATRWDSQPTPLPSQTAADTAAVRTGNSGAPSAKQAHGITNNRSSGPSTGGQYPGQRSTRADPARGPAHADQQRCTDCTADEGAITDRLRLRLRLPSDPEKRTPDRPTASGKTCRHAGRRTARTGRRVDGAAC